MQAFPLTYISEWRNLMFKASIWLGVGYIMILIAIIIYLLYKQIEKY